MSTICIVLFSEYVTNLNTGEEDCDDTILKAFVSLDSAKKYIADCYESRLDELVETNADIEYQSNDNVFARIEWTSTEAHINGITCYSILRTELAD